MTLGKLKKNIYSILGLSVETELPEIYYLIDSTARKVASACKCIKKSAEMNFTYSGGRVCTAMPDDFICACKIGNCDGRELEILGDRLCTTTLGAGCYTVVYYAYPVGISQATPDETELDYDNATADVIAYGTAFGLCGRVYPGDTRRYVELATEYDERMFSLASPSSGSVHNSVFTRARGI